MIVVRHLRLIAVAATLFAVGAVVVRGAQPPPPGRYLSWAPPAASSAAPAAGPTISIATPSPGSTQGGLLGGLTLPLSGLFKQLDSETATSASGQYSMLQALEDAVASRIQGFLAWVTQRR